MSEFACVVVAGVPALSLTVASALEALLRSFAVPLKIHQPQTAEKAEGMPRAAEVGTLLGYRHYSGVCLMLFLALGAQATVTGGCVWGLRVCTCRYRMRPVLLTLFQLLPQ